MRISRLRIENFRSIRNLDIDLGETTVLIGPNNAGKTAILEALRIVLTRRWGQRGTGFTENDVHRSDPDQDPRTLPPVRITIAMEEPQPDDWDEDMVAALEDIMTVTSDGMRNVITLQVTCAWNEEKEAFDPTWQFLDSAGETLPERRRAINLTGFFAYMPFFWLGALRDAADEFTSRSSHWSRLLKSVRIPDQLETDTLQTLEQLDARIVAADPRLSGIAMTIGQATRVAIGEGLGGARLASLPLSIEEMVQRTAVLMRNEDLRPWLPLGHHGQGLQSLAVIFLRQAVVLQQLAESERPGVEAVFAIEEPEAHLHPQAARTLWERIQVLSGQKFMTTHSPHFLQHVPLRDIRIVRLRGGRSEIAALQQPIVSDLPWNPHLDGFVNGRGRDTFSRDAQSNCVAARRWFNQDTADRLLNCYRSDPELAERSGQVQELRRSCRLLPSAEDEEELGFHGRRVRGEIFFARRWVLVEGVTEYLLVHAIGKALDWPLDDHGVAVVDFQQSGNAGIYPALADAFHIPWHMIVDGDQEARKFRRQILDRGFREDDLTGRFATLGQDMDLEAQLVADGHEQLLREILTAISGRSALECSVEELLSRLRNRKTGYMGNLSQRISTDETLAREMPRPFVDVIAILQED